MTPKHSMRSLALLVLFLAAPAWAQLIEVGGKYYFPRGAVSGDIIPNTDDSVDQKSLGSSTRTWQFLYVASLLSNGSGAARIAFQQSNSNDYYGTASSAAGTAHRFGNQGATINSSGMVAAFYSDGMSTLVGSLDGAGNLDIDGQINAITYREATGFSRFVAGGNASNGAGADGMWLINGAALSALDDRYLITMFRDNQSNAIARVTAAGQFIPIPQTLTIASDGAGTAAASTSTPQSGRYRVTCNDTDGCDLTLGESNTTNGSRVTIVNVSANVLNFADTAGVSELAGAFAAGQYDTITVEYVTDRWVEVARSNN